MAGRVDGWVEGVDADRLVASHLMAPVALRADDFEAFTKARSESLSDAIETAMGKPVYRETGTDEPESDPLDADDAAKAAEQAERAETVQDEAEREFNKARRYDGGRSTRKTTTPRSRRRQPDTIGEALGQAVVKELGGITGRRIIRGIFGNLFKGR